MSVGLAANKTARRMGNRTWVQEASENTGVTPRYVAGSSPHKTLLGERHEIVADNALNLHSPMKVLPKGHLQHMSYFQTVRAYAFSAAELRH